jgi:hypothetical protein
VWTVQVLGLDLGCRWLYWPAGVQVIQTLILGFCGFRWWHLVFLVRGDVIIGWIAGWCWTEVVYVICDESPVLFNLVQDIAYHAMDAMRT